eukprot:6196949-Pyramimonas_sp.AAC.1
MATGSVVALGVEDRAFEEICARRVCRPPLAADAAPRRHPLLRQRLSVQPAADQAGHRVFEAAAAAPRAAAQGAGGRARALLVQR